MTPESDPGQDPFSAIDRWMAEAEATEPRVPDAMQLATADAQGRPSVRTVLLKGWGPEGLVFYTNHTSRKGRQLLANPHASVCLHFKDLARQIIAEGPVEQVPEAMSDAYFASRPRGSRIGAWASDQSSVLPERDDLERRVAEETRRFQGQEVPRPPHWGGFRLVPERIEFWQDMPSRLHHRVLFTRGEDGAWTRCLLHP